MTQEEIKEWMRHVSILQDHVKEFNRYDCGYDLKQKEKYSQQRVNAIKQIKKDLLGWPPFAEISYKINKSPFCFDECYDNMDWGMEQTIREIIGKDIG